MMSEKGDANIRPRKGFALIELVIGILITAVLSGSAIAGGSNVIKQSRITRVKSDLRNFQIAAEATLVANPSAVSITNNNVSQNATLFDIVNEFDMYLGTDYKLISYEPLDSIDAGTVKIIADTKNTGKYAVFESKKTDAWGMPYYILFDSSERHIGTADFTITVACAGPNSMANIGGEVDQDDLVLVVESCNNQVSSEVFNISKASSVSTETKTMKISGFNKGNDLVLTYVGDTALTATAIVMDNSSTDSTPSLPPEPSNSITVNSGSRYYVVYAPDASIEVPFKAMYNRFLLVDMNSFTSKTGITINMEDSEKFEWYRIDGSTGETTFLQKGYYLANPNADSLD